MSALEAFGGKSPALPVLLRLSRSVGSLGGGIHAACAADIDFTLGLGVEIEEDFALENARFEGLGSGHTGLLVKGHENFERTVLDVIGLENRKRESDSETVVGAKRCALCADPVAIDYGLDRVFLKIVNGVGVFLRHHIHMALKNDAFHIFAAHSGGFSDNHISDGLAVDDGLKAVADAPVVEIGRDFLFVL